MRSGKHTGAGEVTPPAKPSVESRRNIVSSIDEFLSHAVAVTRAAERNLAIYTGRLEPEVYAHPSFIEAVKRLVLARPFARIRILIAEPHCGPSDHPLIAVAARLPTLVEMRIMRADQYDASAFIVADESAVVYRMHCTRWDGIAELYDPPVAKLYLGRFECAWADAGKFVMDSEQSQSA